MADFKTINENGWKVSNPFRVITSKSVYDIGEDEYDEAIVEHNEEGNQILRDKGFEFDRDYLMHFGDGSYRITSIDDAIESLALKDGCDLVEFENGNFGYVGYYNGFNENWFEIIETEEVSEHCYRHENMIAIDDEGYYWISVIEDLGRVLEAIDIIEKVLASDNWLEHDNRDAIQNEFYKQNILFNEIEF